MRVVKNALEYLLSSFVLTCSRLGLAYFQNGLLPFRFQPCSLEGFGSPSKIEYFICRISGRPADPCHVTADKALMTAVTGLLGIFKGSRVGNDGRRITTIVHLRPSKAEQCPGLLGIITTPYEPACHLRDVVRTDRVDITYFSLHFVQDRLHLIVQTSGAGKGKQAG